MPNFSIERDLAFLLSDAARLLRTCADQKARQFGMTRAQWAVLFRLERAEGLKQAELADLLEVQPITLTRLIDRLCENGLIERRSDPSDRRAKRLFLTPAAKPVMDQLSVVSGKMMANVLVGLDQRERKAMVASLTTIKNNLRAAIQNRMEAEFFRPFKSWNKAMADPALRAPDPVLKVVSRPEADLRKVSFVGVFRQYRRVILLIVLPLLAAIVGLTIYLTGGRYISTDNAYVGAQKVLITPDVAGKISRIDVIEGQHVDPGDLLFEIDPVPFQLAVTQAESKLAMVETDFAPTMKTNLKSMGQLIQLARQMVDLKESDVHDPARANFWLPTWARRWTPTTRWRRLLAPRRRLNNSASRKPGSATSSWATPTCRSKNFRLIGRHRPRSIRPSAISSTPSCMPRSRAGPLRSTASSSAVT